MEWEEYLFSKIFLPHFEVRKKSSKAAGEPTNAQLILLKTSDLIKHPNEMKVWTKLIWFMTQSVKQIIKF